MKVLKIILTAALTVTMLCSTVLAVGSPEKGDGPSVVSATDASGDVTNLIVSTRMGTSSPYGAINDHLASARNDISAAGENPAQLKDGSGVALEAKLQELLGDDYDANELKFLEVFDLSKVVDGEVVAPDGSISITVEYAAASPFVILHQNGSGVWSVVSGGSSAAGGNITVGGTGVYAFLTASAAKAPARDGGTPSPQTGEYVTRYVLLAAAALMVAGVVCVKRAKKSSVK